MKYGLKYGLLTSFSRCSLVPIETISVEGRLFKVQKRILFLVFAIAFVMAGHAAIAGDQTVAYPNKDKAVFTVTAPDDWEMTPGEDEGDYFTLEGPSGAVLSFRAIDGTKDDLEGAVKDGIVYLKENYDDAKIGKPEPMDGVDGAVIHGTGKLKDDGTPCVIEMEWFVLKSGQIAEIWFEAAADDREGAAQAKEILSTFKGM